MFHPRVSGSRFQVWPRAMGLDCAGLENHFLPSQYPWLCKCPHREGSGCWAVYFGCGLADGLWGEGPVSWAQISGHPGQRPEPGPCGCSGLPRCLGTEVWVRVKELTRRVVAKRVLGVPLPLLWTLGDSGLRHGSLGRDSLKSTVIGCEKTKAIRAGRLSSICVCLLKIFFCLFVF